MKSAMKKYRKPYRVKRKKSVLKSRFFRQAFSGLIIFGAAFYFLFFSNYFQIEKIAITGQERLSGDSIKLAVENWVGEKMLFFETKSIFLVNPNKIKEEVLKKFSQIETVQASRKLPDFLSLKVAERKEIGIFCRDTACFMLDKEGVIFHPVDGESFPAGLLKFYNSSFTKDLNLGEKVIDKEILTIVLEIVSKLQEKLKIALTEISIGPVGRIDVKTGEGWQIYFSLKEDLSWQITKLAAILEKRILPEKREKLEYIDLRFEKVYIFPETYNE